MNKIRELYYRFKYRPEKGSAGAIGVIYKSKREKSDFDAELERLAHVAVPCFKTNREVLEYIESKHTLRRDTLSPSHLKMLKINYILSQRPELLKAPPPDYIDSGKMPSRKEFLRVSERERRRFEEAEDYPEEELNLDFQAYTFYHNLPNGKNVLLTLIAENSSDTLVSLSSSADGELSDDEQQQIRCIIADIFVFKGVTKEDIENRTNRFKGYAMDLKCAEQGGIL